MLQNLKKQRKQEGFTIIEVLIVLAIAGLIMLVVFLAVPALQRNSRNSQRTSEAGRIASAVQEVVSNNNGSLNALDSAKLQAAVGTLGYYTTASNITVATGTAPTTPTNSTSVDSVTVYKGTKCTAMQGSDTGLGASSNGANARQFTVVFSAETGNGVAKRCIDS